MLTLMFPAEVEYTNAPDGLGRSDLTPIIRVVEELDGTIVEILGLSAPAPAAPIAMYTSAPESGLYIIRVWQLSGIAVAGATLVVAVADATVAV